MERRRHYDLALITRSLPRSHRGFCRQVAHVKFGCTLEALAKPSLRARANLLVHDLGRIGITSFVPTPDGILSSNRKVHPFTATV